jgi:hypothetical protein
VHQHSRCNRALWAADNWLIAIRNQRIDDCFATLVAMKGHANRCISLLDRVPADNIWSSYDQAWDSHTRFSAAWTIARRYDRTLPDGRPDHFAQILYAIGRLIKEREASQFDRSQVDKVKQDLEANSRAVEQELPFPEPSISLSSLESWLKG